ncbi:restriction endonuclease subunit S [Lacticaseibacillus casei]|uniref:restriction endonuclease subunit S n=1 Tax=Lacticaseibacillus casei TaxID=1582 RepID=UPI00237DF552|nr:restriction endonuclease subunit S [Lacticaseibacillus casei]MDE3283047.1 restriction endonuclease subunit S [Lacticaseibacillus casei]
MSKDVKNVPALRFKGFSDAWEKRKFKDIVTRVNQMSNDSKLPSVEFEDIVSGQGRLRKSAHLKFNTKKGISFQPRDVLFGKLRPYLHNWLFPNFHGRAVGDFWVLRANSNVFPGYLFQLVQAPRFQSIANISSGTKMPRSDWKTVAESHFLLPDVSEQKRIWQLFKVLDDLIAATQGKLDQLQMVKKALLQHLFDQSMRFKGYSDPWEKRKLGDLSTIRRGASPRPISSPKWFSGTSSVGWLRISDVTEQNGRVYSVAQHLSEKGQKKTLVLTKRHLILSIAATVGKPVQNYTALGIHDGFIVFMNPKFDLDFMFYFLEKYQPQWMRFGQPGSQVNLNSELVRNLEIRLPRRDEQEQVSKILLKLDNLIAATQSKLSSLESLKKALLQGLFI